MNHEYLAKRTMELDRRYLEHDRLLREFVQTGSMESYHAALAARERYWELRGLMCGLPAKFGEVGAGAN